MEIKEFGSYIKQLRLKKDISTHKLASLSGVSQSYISHLENGRKKNTPSPEVIQKLAMNLDVSFVELMVAAGYWDKEELLDEILDSDFNFIPEPTPYVEAIRLREPRITQKKNTDLKKILMKTDLVFNGKPITEKQRNLLKAYTDLLFDLEEDGN